MDKMHSPVGFFARPDTIEDFATFTTSGTAGAQVIPASQLPTHTLLLGVPTRTGVGVWAATILEAGVQDVAFDINIQEAISGHHFAVQQPTTYNTAGQAVINWTFEVSTGLGTATDVASGTSFTLRINVTCGQD